MLSTYFVPTVKYSSNLYFYSIKLMISIFDMFACVTDVHYDLNDEFVISPSLSMYYVHDTTAILRM